MINEKLPHEVFEQCEKIRYKKDRQEYLQKHGMKVIRSEIINVHGSRVELDDDVPEFQELVVATATMGGEDC